MLKERGTQSHRLGNLPMATGSIGGVEGAEGLSPAVLTTATLAAAALALAGLGAAALLHDDVIRGLHAWPKGLAEFKGGAAQKKAELESKDGKARILGSNGHEKRHAE